MSVCVCAHVCMCVCACVCVCVCVCVCAHVCARVLVPARVGSHAMLIWVMHMFPRVHCVHVHANVCVHVCVYARACVCMHVRACVRMHARACAKLGVEGGGGGGLTVLVLYSSILWCSQGQCGSGFTVQGVHVNAHL